MIEEMIDVSQHSHPKCGLSGSWGTGGSPDTRPDSRRNYGVAYWTQEMLLENGLFNPRDSPFLEFQRATGFGQVSGDS